MPDFEPVDPAMHASMNLDGDLEALRSYYADWAETYDDDVAPSYALSHEMVSTLRQAAAAAADLTWITAPETRVIDAGCGTGLLGVELAAAGFAHIHGVDLSEEMTAIARSRGVYTELESGVDLTAPLPDHLAGCFDLCTVAGVLTVGHVPPSTLENLARLVRPGGALIASVRDAYYADEPFQQVSDELQERGVLELIVRRDDAPYTMDSTAKYFAYRVLRP